jgi:alkylation response protein AidB-like acyl-CoA dehydrogenase
MESKWISLAEQLGKDFGTRAAEHDRDDSFVAENYAKLREHRAFGAAVPAELEGGGASHAEVCAMIRALARECGSTALAYSMHSHLVSTLAYLWRAGNRGPEGLLKRIATENLILVSTGASDWLAGSGTLEKVEGGFRLTGKKIFGSGVPMGDLLMTMGVYDDPKDGPTVYHFPLPLKAEGVTVLDTWKTLGMRGTGSHDIEIKGAFLPDQVMQGVRRPSGKWHPFFHAVCLVALPLVYSAYVGVAESARKIALELAARRKRDPLLPLIAGELDNHLVGAQLGLESMIAMTASEKPGPATTAAVSCRRALVVTNLLGVADKALELAGGAGFYRAQGLERCFRDLQGARYHPIPEKAQTLLAGRVALGLDIDG